MHRRDALAFGVLWVAVIVSRFFALSKTISDWDETLFAFGVDEYDVRVHHPHPPGYPLFILAAKFARLFVASDFRALQAVATIASALIFPAVFLLARELRMRVPESLAAALMASFLPTIWYYGGTGLSDVPAACLAVFASALLLRGGRDPRAYLAGSLVAALAAGIRPHLLMIAAVPALVSAFALRRARIVALSWAAGAAAVMATYGAAAYFSADFPNGYLEELREIAVFVRNVDSLANPDRPPLRELAPKTLWFPYAGGDARWWIAGFSIVALLRPRTSGIVLAMFAPIAVFTWLSLDFHSLPRYAVAYVVAYAILAAIGIGVVADRLPRMNAAFLAMATLVVTITLIEWVRPALRVAREAAPTAAAFDWIRNSIPSTGPRIFVENELELLGRYLSRGYDTKFVYEPHDIRAEDLQPGNLYVVEGTSRERGARVFARQRNELWEIARPRYFEVSVIPMHSMVWYAEGWFGTDDGSEDAPRWMGPKSRAWVATFGAKTIELRARFYVPVDTTPRPPAVSVVWNGKLVERVVPPGNTLDLRYVLTSQEAANVLDLEVDVWANPSRDGTGDDARDLGLQLIELSWQPLQ